MWLKLHDDFRFGSDFGPKIVLWAFCHFNHYPDFRQAVSKEKALNRYSPKTPEIKIWHFCTSQNSSLTHRVFFLTTSIFFPIYSRCFIAKENFYFICAFHLFHLISFIVISSNSSHSFISSLHDVRKISCNRNIRRTCRSAQASINRRCSAQASANRRCSAQASTNRRCTTTTIHFLFFPQRSYIAAWMLEPELHATIASAMSSPSRTDPKITADREYTIIKGQMKHKCVLISTTCEHHAHVRVQLESGESFYLDVSVYNPSCASLQNETSQTLMAKRWRPRESSTNMLVSHRHPLSSSLSSLIPLVTSAPKPYPFSRRTFLPNFSDS